MWSKEIKQQQGYSWPVYIQAMVRFMLFNKLDFWLYRYNQTHRRADGMQEKQLSYKLWALVEKLQGRYTL